MLFTRDGKWLTSVLGDFEGYELGRKLSVSLGWLVMGWVSQVITALPPVLDLVPNLVVCSVGL